MALAILLPRLLVVELHVREMQILAADLDCGAVVEPRPPESTVAGSRIRPIRQKGKATVTPLVYGVQQAERAGDA